MIGIYSITNKTNGKVYVGQSIDMEKRWKDHIQNLKANIHKNSHMQNAWNKHGQDNFEFSVLEECLEEELNQKEEFYFKKYRVLNRKYGYNIKESGSNGRQSDETKEKISIANSGENNGMYGKQLSEEEKQHLSEINKGRIKSEETRKKLSIANIGKKLSAEHIEKMRQAKIGRKATEETKRKMSLAGKKYYGENRHTAKITEQQAKEIISMLLGRKAIIEIHRETGFPVTIINNIKYKGTWTHLTETVEFPDDVKALPFGEQHANSTITEKQALSVIDLLLKKKSYKEIAKLTGVSTYTVKAIRLKRTWKHLTTNIYFSSFKLSKHDVEEIIILLMQGAKGCEIAKKYNVTDTTISQIKLGKNKYCNTKRVG